MAIRKSAPTMFLIRNRSVSWPNLGRRRGGLETEIAFDGCSVMSLFGAFLEMVFGGPKVKNAPGRSDRASDVVKIGQMFYAPRLCAIFRGGSRVKRDFMRRAPDFV